MRDIPNAEHTLGLELTSSYLKGAELGVRKKKPYLIKTFQIKLDRTQPDTDNVKPLYKEDQSNQLIKLAKSALTVTVLDTSEVLVRKLDVDLIKEKDIDAVLDFQTEPMLPYPMEQGLIDRIIVEKQTEGTILTVVAARKDFISKHIEKWRSIEIEPELISCVPVALAEFSKYFCTSEVAHLITHIGDETTTFIIAKKGKLISAQTISMGTKALLEAYGVDLKSPSDNVLEKFKQLDFALVNENETPALAAALEGFRLEVTKVSYSLIKKIREFEISDLFTTGEGTLLRNLPQVLYKSIKITHLEPIIDPDFNCSVEELQAYAIPIGAALNGMPYCNNAINFRQNEYAYPHPWKRVQKPLALYFVLCVTLAFAFYMFGNAYINRQQDEIKLEYVNLLASMKKPYSLFEAEFNAAISRGKANEEPPVDVMELTQEDIIQRLDFLNKELTAAPDVFPLLPNVPKVSDVLGWMTRLINTSESKGTADAEDSSIQLTSFSYKMMKRPEYNKKKEVYQVKVELEFTTNAPKSAREFHDALVAPNDFVDPNSEIKWSSERGKYRISFFLKDRTYYPSKGAGNA